MVPSSQFSFPSFVSFLFLKYLLIPREYMMAAIWGFIQVLYDHTYHPLNFQGPEWLMELQVSSHYTAFSWTFSKSCIAIISTNIIYIKYRNTVQCRAQPPLQTTLEIMKISPDSPETLKLPEAPKKQQLCSYSILISLVILHQPMWLPCVSYLSGY